MNTVSGRPGRAPRVEVIILPGGGLSDLRHCVESVVRHTQGEYRLLLQDDGRDPRVSGYLEEVTHFYPQVGPVQEAGARAEVTSSATSPHEYFVYLRPETVVTPGWLQKLVACAESDPSIMAVSALSSCNDDVPIQMLPGFTLFEIAALVEKLSDRTYPTFTSRGSPCLLVRGSALAGRAQIASTGDLDEPAVSALGTFLLTSGGRLVCADDTFVYRTAGTYGRRQASAGPVEYLRDRIAAVRNPVWFPYDAPPPASTCEAAVRLQQHRAWRFPLEQSPLQSCIVFLLPVLESFGGVISVVNLANEMVLRGEKVRLLTMSVYNNLLHRLYTAPIAFQARDEIADLFPDADIGVATQWETVEPILRVAAEGHLTPFYFVQDYEVDFLPEADLARRQQAQDTYRRIKRKIVKTNYLRRKISEVDPVVFKINPGMDLDLFHPRPADEATRSRRVLAMARPSTPWRGFDVMCRTFAAVHRAHPEVEFVLYGTDDLAPHQAQMDFPYTNLGRLPSRQLPEVYSSCAVYVDCSHSQGFGRTGAEAMACGSACVLTRTGGVFEYAIDGWNALLCDIGDAEALASAISALLEDPVLRQTLIRNGLTTVQPYAEPTAAEQMRSLFENVRSGGK